MLKFYFIALFLITSFSFAQNGNLKAGFGVDGKLVIDIDDLDELVGVCADGQGNTYFYGNTSSNLGGIYPFDFYIGKFDGNGVLDAQFGNNGIFRSDFPGFGISSINKAVYHSSGIYIIGGGVNQGVPDTNALFIGKLTLDGQIDTSFADNGFFTSDFLGAYNTPGSLIIDNEGKIVFCGSTTNDGGTWLEYSLIGRLDLNGQPDTTFGTSGLIVWDYFAGNWVNALNLPDYAHRHGEGAYVSEIVEIGNNYYAAGRFVATSYDQLQIMSISKQGDFNNNFLGSAPLVFQVDPGFNHLIHDMDVLNGVIYMAIQTDGENFDQQHVIQAIDTNGIMGSVFNLEYPGHDCRTNAIEIYDDKLFFGGYSRLLTNNSPDIYQTTFCFMRLMRI